MSQADKRKWFRCMLPLFGVTGRSLWRKLPGHPSCSPFMGQRSCLLPPMGGEKSISGGWRWACTQLYPFPYDGSQRRSGLKGPCKDLSASLAGGVSPKLGTLAAASYALRKTCSAAWAKQIRYDSRGFWACVASFSSLGPPRCPRVVTPACTLWNHSEGNGCDWCCNTKIMWERTQSKTWWDNIIGKRLLFSKALQREHFFLFTLKIIVNKHFLYNYFEYWPLLQ